MAFTAADEQAVRRNRFVYRRGADDVHEEARDRRLIESANQLLPTVTTQVCEALRHTFASGEELRELVPMLSYQGMNGRATSVRYDAIACTDRQVHLVLAGSDTGVEVRLFPYGTLDADTKLLKMTPELTVKKGRPVLVVPRLGGRESTFDALLAAPPTARNAELARDVTPPPPGWYPDPMGRYRLRYWDGAAWTANAANDGAAVQDPVS
jgi:hypothetical protein